MTNGKSRPSQLWEQWLARLHGIEDPQKNYYRLELLELLSRFDAAETGRFYHRLVTVLRRSLHTSDVLVINPGGEIAASSYGESGARLEKTLSNRLPKPNHGITVRHYARPICFRKGEPTRTAVQLPLLGAGDSKTVLIVLYPGSLSPDDRRFLYFIAGILKFLELQVDLSHRLSREQKLVRSLTQNLGEGLALFSRDLRALIWNRPLQRMTGYSPKEATGQSYEQVLAFKNRPGWLKELSDAYGKDPEQSGFFTEGEIITKNKHTRWVAVSGSFLRDEEGRIEQAITLVRDISHLKALEQRKNDFISIATHELRTPITVIKGYLSLLKRDPANFSDKQREYLDNAYQATERLVGLAEDLLQVIRLDEDRMKFNLQPIQLSKVIEKVSNDFSERARRKGLEFQLTLPPFSTTVIADPIRLEQVFANLVDNAIKYTTRGSVSIAFEHYSDKLTNEEKVAVLIKDTGIGIEAKDLTGIFDKFHRSDKAAMLREPGAGLGLYIVKSFIEKQGGSITVKSRTRRGSSFAVTFPIVSARERVVK